MYLFLFILWGCQYLRIKDTRGQVLLRNILFNQLQNLIMYQLSLWTVVEITNNIMGKFFMHSDSKPKNKL